MKNYKAVNILTCSLIMVLTLLNPKSTFATGKPILSCGRNVETVTTLFDETRYPYIRSVQSCPGEVTFTSAYDLPNISEQLIYLNPKVPVLRIMIDEYTLTFTREISEAQAYGSFITFFNRVDGADFVAKNNLSVFGLFFYGARGYRIENEGCPLNIPAKRYIGASAITPAPFPRSAGSCLLPSNRNHSSNF